MKPKLLFHVCCAPCSGFLASELLKDFALTVYYDNSNIWPESEFLKRAKEAAEFFNQENIKFILADWQHEQWRVKVQGLEQEPERGKRCFLCYQYRLEKTARFAKSNGFEYFATSLIISPHKDAKIIIDLGRELARKYGLQFLAEDFKKNDGCQKANAFSRAKNFYRQNYCGCEFSMRQKS